MNLNLLLVGNIVLNQFVFEICPLSLVGGRVLWLILIDCFYEIESKQKKQKFKNQLTALY